MADGHFNNLKVYENIDTKGIILRGIIRGDEPGNNTVDVSGKLKANFIEVTNIIKAGDVLITSS